MEIVSKMFIYFLDIMAEIYKGVNVKNFEIISTVEDTCFFNIPEGEIWQEKAEIQG